jgi:hypothetical protein
MINNEQKQRLQQPSWIDLPLAAARSSNSNQQQGERSSWSMAELVVGRLAMVGAISLLVGEIMTGQTFWQQMLQAATVHMMSTIK